MFQQNIKNFDINQIAESGQCFRMLPVAGEDNAYSVVSGGRILKISGGGEEFLFDCPEEDRKFWERYFDLGTDYGAFLSSIDPKDSYLLGAAACGSGIRILRQDPWEMIITFIISQQKTIPAIRRLVEELCRNYGAPLSAPGLPGAFYSFPSPEELNRASLEELLALRLGYRAKYIKKICEDACTGILDLSLLEKMDYEAAMDYLQGFYGIGKKVANCICLFGLHHIEAFPVDTWIRKILLSEYAPRYKRGRRKMEKMSDDRLCEELVKTYFSRYGGFAGVMQQYMFFAAREKRQQESETDRQKYRRP